MTHTMMNTRTYRRYFTSGVAFLRDHPQLWFTAVVAVVIVSSFVFVAYRFASIARDAQDQLIQIRTGGLLDSIVLFAPDTLEQPDVLRSHLHDLRTLNNTIDYLLITAPHGNNAWRVYLSDNGPAEGSVFTPDDPGERMLYASALNDPANAYTYETVRNNERYFITARAVQNSAGAAQALAVSGERLSEADRLIASNMNRSMAILAVIMVFIMALFIRHARIIDYAQLYKKQLEVDEMKDSFISMASHELKSPLTVIRGYIEFLKDTALDAAERQEYLGRVDRSADELRQLIDDILDVSRIEMGRLRFSPDYVEPYEVLCEVRDMFTDSARAKDLSLVLTVADDVRHASLRVDRGRLKQVLVNLISNAVKYTLAGSITIDEVRRDGTVELSVRDTGVGMTSDEQKKLFGKFYRVEANETKGVSGTGLGLWITKYIVEHMEGAITVESIKGEGTRFVVAFPDHSFDGMHEGTE